MNSRDITVYLDERWCDALETHTGKTMEELLTEQMDSLIQQLPQDQRERITQEIREEDQIAQALTEANRRFSITRITENGESRCLLMERGEIMFQTAQRLRRYLRGELQDPAQFYGDAALITQEEMERHTAELLRGSPRVVGIYDIDLDAGEIYALDPEKGWRGYKIKDVSVAAYFATKRESDSWIAKRNRFYGRLGDKELPRIVRPIAIRGTESLPTDLLCFEEEISQIDHLLNFYIPVHFDVDAVCGTYVNTAGNGDWLNLYANYDMEQGCVCDTLAVTLVRDTSPDLECEYRLTPEEQELLCSKMDSYCQEQMGISLKTARAQYLAEEQSSAPQEEPSQKPAQQGPTLQM